MTYTSIIAPVADGPEVEKHLEAAVMLAQAYGARLIGSGAEYCLASGPGGALGGPDISGDLAMLERTLLEDELAGAERRFRAATHGYEFNCEWHGAVELPLNALRRRALLADLVVLGAMPADRHDVLRCISTGDAVTQTGRPVLRVASSGMAEQPRTVAIAWKDGRPARRAVADALPFLRRAETVLAYTAPEHGRRDEATESLANLTSYLARHGVRATAVCLPNSDNAGDDLLEAIARSRAELIVAGAYGRSKLQEWIFGGVTRTLLGKADTAVLFSH